MLRASELDEESRALGEQREGARRRGGRSSPHPAEHQGRRAGHGERRTSLLSLARPAAFHLTRTAGRRGDLYERDRSTDDGIVRR